jgi:hypothetical protein
MGKGHRMTRPTSRKATLKAERARRAPNHCSRTELPSASFALSLIYKELRDFVAARGPVPGTEPVVGSATNTLLLFVGGSRKALSGRV